MIGQTVIHDVKPIVVKDTVKSLQLVGIESNRQVEIKRTLQNFRTKNIMTWKHVKY